MGSGKIGWRLHQDENQDENCDDDDDDDEKDGGSVWILKKKKITIKREKQFPRGIFRLTNRSMVYCFTPEGSRIVKYVYSTLSRNSLEYLPVWLCDNVVFYLSEVYPNNPCLFPSINDHVSIMWSTGITFTPVRNMPGGSPGLSPRFSLAYSVVNPCIVVLAVILQIKKLLLLQNGEYYSRLLFLSLEELNGASSGESKARRGNLTSCGRSRVAECCPDKSSLASAATVSVQRP